MGHVTNLGKDSNGNWVPMGATTDSSGNPAVSTVVAPILGPTLIYPSTVAAASSTDTNGNTIEIKTRDNASSDLGYLLMTINGTDDAGDSARFNAPDETVHQLRLGRDYVFRQTSDITRVSIVCVGRENNLTSGVVLPGEGTGNIATALNTFTFAAGTRAIRVSASDRYGSSISGETNRIFATFSVVGSA